MNEKRVRLEGLVALYNRFSNRAHFHEAKVSLGNKGYHIEFLAMKNRYFEKNIGKPQNVYEGPVLDAFVKELEEHETEYLFREGEKEYLRWAEKNLSERERIALGILSETKLTYSDVVSKVPEEYKKFTEHFSIVKKEI